jgi:hypothetical protein
MAVPARAWPASTILRLLLGLVMAAVPAGAMAMPQARLVHCGGETCLRLSGHRLHPAVAVRVAGHDLTVKGGRSWNATVPLQTARDWANRAGDTLRLTLADARTGTETEDAVALPPGALGKRVELATLVISAH